LSYLWLAKYVVQKVISTLPCGEQVNKLLQQTVGGLRKPVIYGYPRTLTMIWLLGQLDISIRGCQCVELGTGWDLSSAMTLVRLGAAKVHTYDHVRHALPELKARALAMIESSATPTDSDLPFDVPFQELTGLLREPHGEVEYHAPFDARQTALLDASIDFYYSFATLEHIPVDVLKELLQESFRILKPGAYCYHYIQPSMHSLRWSDSSVDYLIFPQATWDKWIANPIAYENRLRAVQHLDLLKQAGFDIVHAWFNTDHRALKRLPEMRLAPAFERFTPEQLAQNYVWVVGRKP
jgi:SAM-dependent methyltransferase